jgi:hypothetical protein
MGRGWLVPKEDPRGSSGSGLRYRKDDGGAIFGQSQERQSGRATDWIDGLEGVGKGGIEGQEGRVHACFTRACTVRARVLEDEPPRASVAANVRRAAGKPIPRTLLGQFPPSRGSPRKGGCSGDGAREAMFRAERGCDPEDPMNPIPGRPPAESVRWSPVQTA